MFIRAFTAAVSLVALPAAASALPLADTHEQVGSPAKGAVLYRPIAQTRTAPAKCHPDAAKAMVCEAQAAADRNKAQLRD